MRSFKKALISSSIAVLSVALIISLLSTPASASEVLERPAWFVDDDNEVGLSDLMVVSNHYGGSGSSADVDKDGTVGLVDIMIVAQHYGEIWDITPPEAPYLNEDHCGRSWSGHNSPHWYWSSSDAGSGVKWYEVYCNWTGSYFITTDTEYHPTVPDGARAIWVRAQDWAGNWSNWSSPVWVYIDATPPTPPDLVSPADGDRFDDSTPLLDWTFNIGYGESTPILYHVQVDDSSNFTSVNRDSGWISTDQWEVAPALGDGVWYWRVRAKDCAGNVGSWSSTRSFRIDTNRAPNPPVLWGPTELAVNTISGEFYVEGTDPDGDSLRYFIDWGDGTASWTNWAYSGEKRSATHKWSKTGTYRVRAKAYEAYGSLESEWSSNLMVSVDDDSNSREIGVWAISNGLSQWWWPDADLPSSVPNAQKFYNVLVSEGFTGRFKFFDENVKEKHFETPPFGEDYNYVDSCDFIFFSSHGRPATLIVGTGLFPDTYDIVELNETVMWGDLDLEWAFLLSCRTLNDSMFIELTRAFDGRLHGLCGFHTACQGQSVGEFFAKYATDLWGSYTIGESWIRATKISQPDNVWGAMLYGVKGRVNFRDEYLPGYMSGMFGDPDYDNGWAIAYYKWKCDSI